MGITHHEHGVANVQSIANLAMMRGMLGRPASGLLPLRGHSNVQGIGSMGVTPKLRDSILRNIEQQLRVTLPTTPGLDTLEGLHRAAEGRIRLAWCLGGNLYGSSPDASFVSGALARIDTLVYFSTTLNTGHAHGRGRETIILPVLARDEERQATTQESMFNYVRFSDGGIDRLEGPRSEVEVIAGIAEAVLGKNPGPPLQWRDMASHARIRDLIARVVPGYEPVADIDRTRREFHIAGRTLHEPRFPTDTGRAKFHAVALPPVHPRPSHDSELGTQNSELRLMTIRSEGQFNTVVYEEEDLYRGQERRDVIMMNANDIARLGLQIDQRVIVRSEAGSLANVLVREIDIRAGNAAMYYPEANALVPRRFDERSRTPAFKRVAITVEPDVTANGTGPAANGQAAAAAGPRRTLPAC
jgi:molybdopterin-dependent oxidoreductase alpha subunit